MNMTSKMLNGLRYIACLPIILMLMIITAPLTLFFKWEGIIILAIANHVGCSLSEAKRLLKEDPRYKITRNNPKGIANMEARLRASDNYYQVNSPTYKHLPFNTHHRS